jgi:hypothetical protein
VFGSTARASRLHQHRLHHAAGVDRITATGIDAETVAFAWRDNSAVEDDYHLLRLYCYYYYSVRYCWSALVVLGEHHQLSAQNSTAYSYSSYAVAAVKDGGYSTW